MKPTITLEIVSVIREFDLETQKETTRMKCRLPVTGDAVILPVDTDYLQEMIAASAAKGAEEEEPRRPRTSGGFVRKSLRKKSLGKLQRLSRKMTTS